MIKKHKFIIPTYNYSLHLESCILSLIKQSDPSDIQLSTSTPNEMVSKLSERYLVPKHVHLTRNGIGSDWNAAVKLCDLEWVTLAHQDDVYYTAYASEIKKAITDHPDALIIFTDYDEIKNGIVAKRSNLVRLKRALLELGFLGRNKIRSKWAKKNCLRFGCAIPCPTVTFRIYPNFNFDESLKVNLDWDAWLRLAESHGSFVWIRKPLMGHRIHEEQESNAAIKSGVRQREDILILKRLWPSFLAHLIEKTYRLIR